MELNTIRSVLEETAEPESQYLRWNSELTYAIRELTPWHNNAVKATLRYANKTSSGNYGDTTIGSSFDAVRFNLFAANVDVLQSALFSTPPEVAVSRKFDDFEDDLARVGAEIVQRILQDDMADYNGSFSALCSSVVQDRLVAGCGTGWLRIQLDEENQMDPVTKEVVVIVTGQKIEVDYVNWRDLLWSPCKTWESRRWVGRRVFMSYDAGVKRFGEVFKNVPLDRPQQKDNSSGGGRNRLVQEAEIYEIWDREGNEVIWLSLAYPAILDKKKDYLLLDNFEPTPKPLLGLVTTDMAIPIPDYIRWIDQYTELDNVNARISMLTKACRATGVYDKAQVGVKRLMQEGSDNELIPVDNWAMFAEKGGLKGTIDWLPLDVVVSAQETLRGAREDIKAQIYELTGISDVVRGTSNPHETLGAQRIKADFASSRIQVLQGAFEAWVCGILKMKAELMVKHFPAEDLLKMSNIMNTQDADIALQAVEAMKQTGFMDYRIAIEPFSMAQIDFAQEKNDRIEFLTTIGGFIEKAIVSAEKVPEMVPLMATMIKFGIAGFRISSTIEGAIDKQLDQLIAKKQQEMDNPQPKDPSPEQIRAQSEMQRQQIQMEMEQAKQQFAKEEWQYNMQMEQEKQEHAFEIQKMKGAQEILRLQMQGELEQQQAQQDMAIEQLKAESQMQVGALNAVDGSNKQGAESEKSMSDVHEKHYAEKDSMREEMHAMKMERMQAQIEQMKAEKEAPAKDEKGEDEVNKEALSKLDSLVTEQQSLKDLLKELITVTKAPRVVKRDKDGRATSSEIKT